MATIKDIARSIANSNDMKGRDAEAFVAAIVDTILEGLEKDRLVKIKGFGTFKLTAVRDRESVNVNTGERVVISGHDKISFTPENAVRDLVNKPFAQFDTVVLDDAVDVDAMNAAPEPEPVVEETPAPVVEETPAPVVEETPAPVVEETPAPVVEETPAPVVEETPAPVVEETPAPVVEETPAPVVEETPAPVVEETPAPVVEEPTAGETSGTSCKTVFIAYAVVISVLLACMAFIAGNLCSEYGILNLKPLFQSKEDIEMAVEAKKAETVAEKPASVAVEQKEAKEPEKPVEQKEVKTPEKPVEQKDVKEPEKPVEPTQQAAQYDADPRVRTGAYIIIGVAETVTVKPGQTLKSISKAYLGPDMECYVEVLNGIKEVKEGDKLKIPKLQLKKRQKKA